VGILLKSENCKNKAKLSPAVAGAWADLGNINVAIEEIRLKILHLNSSPFL
jgi:hypothetical protein